MSSAEDLERAIHKTMAGPSSATMEAEARKVRSVEREENTFKVVSNTALVLAAAEVTREEEKAVASRAQSEKEQSIDSSTTVVEVLKLADHVIAMALKKLNDRAIFMAEQAIIYTLDHCELDYNKMFIWRGDQKCSRGFSRPSFTRRYEIHAAFEAAAVQLLGTSTLATEVGNVYVSYSAIFAPGGASIKMAYNAVSRASKAEVSVAPLSLPLSDSDC